MKYVLTSLFFLLVGSSFGQEVSAKFAGDWEGKCLLEKVENTVTSCGICDYAFSQDSSKATIRSFGVNFMDGSMTFKFPNGQEVVSFQYDEKTEHMVFELGGTQYDFSVIYVDVLSQVLLKSRDGSLVYLERKNNMR